MSLVLHTIISYVVAWAYYFITLPLFMRWFGNWNGKVINYIVSWILMLGVIAVLQKPWAREALKRFEETKFQRPS
jgi:hypothetical protein